MTLPVYPNQISADDIRTELGLTGQLAFDTLYTKTTGPIFPGIYGYPGGGPATAIPSSGQIGLGQFHGLTKYVPQYRTVTILPSSGSWTVPDTLIGNLTITLIGGGGGGCHWPSGAAGGAGGGGARYVGPIPTGRTISYVVGSGGPSIYHDSSRYARDAKDCSFGSSGDPWYMYIPGLGTGGYNMTGSNRGPGTGSSAQGNAQYLGKGGNGKPERTAGRAGDATVIRAPDNSTIVGAGGGACDRNDSSGGYGYTLGANGANRKGVGGSNGEGNWPGGGAAGNNSQSPSPWTFKGGDGALFISGTW